MEKQEEQKTIQETDEEIKNIIYIFALLSGLLNIIFCLF